MSATTAVENGSVPRGRPLLPMPYELSPASIAKVIAMRLGRLDLPEDVRKRMAARVEVIEAKEREARRPQVRTERRPWFCSGCPHNTSTKVPEGSRALAGIGCHYLVMGMERNTTTFSQMGGEGVPWLGQMHFSSERHVFANLGDGTYFHSGLLAIRAAIAAKANITYKILYNDAVAMTGGQPIDGVMTVEQIAQQVTAEGASRVVVVSDEPEKYAVRPGWPSTVAVLHRDELESLQRALRETLGTSVLIYEQTCATEQRRRRKRGKLSAPARRAFINEAVCEGCGDCSVASNCLSIEPVQTALGTKRRVNQSTCNQDLSCVNGFCPSFVTVAGAQLKQPAPLEGRQRDFAELPLAQLPSLDAPYRILVTGVGGTGVVTIGALLGMAAHLERKGVTVLDMTGLAQKGGAVYSYVQLAGSPEQIHATRIATGEAHLLIGCDAVVSASAESLSRTRHGGTHAVVNSANTPTADFVLNRDWSFPGAALERDIRTSIGSGSEFVDANSLAMRLLGDVIYANPLLLGYSWQRGWIPLSHRALLQAIELNAVAVDKNTLAFEWGRYIAVHGEAAVSSQSLKPSSHDESLDAIVKNRTELLTAYQNDAYAARYERVVALVRKAENVVTSATLAPVLTKAVAKNLAKLMAYKDEYEVARLHADPAFLQQLRETFAGEPGKDYSLIFHLAPPLLAKRDAAGLPRKTAYGPWMRAVFYVLAKLKVLRHTPFDVFGRTAERRSDRQLIQDYLLLVEEICATVTMENRSIAIELARLPEQIRGYGHVKERRIETVRKQWADLTARYRSETMSRTPAERSKYDYAC